MAEPKDEPELENNPKSPPFVEVVCKSSGKIRRFSAGTEAGFAVKLMNKKLLNHVSGSDDKGNVMAMASYIEAVKDGEGEEEKEPVSFGPNSVLVDYGPGWKLQTVIEAETYDDMAGDGVYVRRRRVPKASSKGINDSDYPEKTSESPLSLEYFGKILIAFAILFIIGAAFTLALENLPQLILYINSSI